MPMSLQEFTEKGHAQIDSGDLLDGRLSVIRLLGKGSYGFVYLAYGPREGQQDASFAAVKVFRHDEPKVAENEIRMMETIKRNKGEDRPEEGKWEHPGYKNVVEFFGHFPLEITSGLHLTLEYELMKETLSSWISRHAKEGTQVHINRVQEIIHQVLKGIQFLSDLQIVHTDLKPDNILIGDTRENNARMARRVCVALANELVPDRDEVDGQGWLNPWALNKFDRRHYGTLFSNARGGRFPQEFYTMEGGRQFDNRMNKAEQRHILDAEEAKMEKDYKGQAYLKVKLADVGTDAATFEYFSPEMIVDAGEGVNPSSMVYAAACVMYSLITGGEVLLNIDAVKLDADEYPGCIFLMEPLVDYDESKDSRPTIYFPTRYFMQLAWMQHLAGKATINGAYRNWRFFETFYKLETKPGSRTGEQQGRVRYVVTADMPSLEELFGNKIKVDFTGGNENQLKTTMFELFQQMIKIEPNDRTTAIQLLEHPFFGFYCPEGKQFRVLPGPAVAKQKPNGQRYYEYRFRTMDAFNAWNNYQFTWFRNKPYEKKADDTPSSSTAPPPPTSATYKCRKTGCLRKMTARILPSGIVEVELPVGRQHDHSDAYEVNFTRAAKDEIDRCVDQGMQIGQIIEHMNELFPRVRDRQIRDFVKYTRKAPE